MRVITDTCDMCGWSGSTNIYASGTIPNINFPVVAHSHLCENCQRLAIILLMDLASPGNSFSATDGPRYEVAFKQRIAERAAREAVTA